MQKAIQSIEYKKIISKLKQARIEAGLTQKQVAEIIKKPQSYISKIEASEQRIDVMELKNFAKLYKKRVNYFL
ncbi:helix-turn-helix transcriptional regulator [Patescibacteria group bacterium]|nr:helix-turn-helix transcriptional regulator [Patescibacteria group bacterium]